MQLKARTLAIAIVAVLAGAAPAHAAGWLPAQPLDAAGTAPALAVAANGTAVAVWIGADGLHAARHTPGVPGFAALPVIAGTGLGGLQVGIDDAGNATAAYLAGTTLQAVTLPAGADAFGDPPATLSTAAPEAPALDVGPDGTAVVAWTEDGATIGTQQVAASVRAPGGSFSAGAPLSAEFLPTAATGHADVDVAAGGHAIVGWIGGLGAASAVRPPDGAFDTAGAPTGGAAATEPAVAIDGAGGATLAWTDGATVQYSCTAGSCQLSASR